MEHWLVMAYDPGLCHHLKVKVLIGSVLLVLRHYMVQALLSSLPSRSLSGLKGYSEKISSCIVYDTEQVYLSIALATLKGRGSSFSFPGAHTGQESSHVEYLIVPCSLPPNESHPVLG
jgi:hypothetical protein